MEEALADASLAGEPCPPLARDVEADVVVIGGGYTGLWSAWFLKERDPALEVVLLEQDVCGGGPSGRNGGFCNGLWEELPLLVGKLGPEGAVHVAEAAERSITEIGAWCGANGVDAWFRGVGHLGVATSSAQDGAWRETVAVAARLGVDEGRFIELDRSDVLARCASPVFLGGLLTPGAATLQPARLARGLRRALLGRGVRIFERTPVRRFRTGSPVKVDTAAGSVRAAGGVFAVGAWASQLVRFRRTILPRGSYLVITEPAPERLAELGWTGGEGLYDFRTALHYLRTTPDGRIAFGAASSRAGTGTGLGPRLRYDEPTVVGVVRELRRWFPPLRDVGVEAAWGGPIDVTGLHLPFFGTFAGGTVHYGLGYTGGGVGPCHLGGKVLSGLALGIDDEHTRLPLVGLSPKPFPADPFRSLGAAAAHEAIVRKDESEDAGRAPGRLTDALARLPRRLGYELGP
jgi:glycine/D-amino acid oxidase-like deaminating enzyme